MPKNISNIKEDILLVTRELLKDTGYEDLNIRTIAARCGIAAGTLYNYYDSKTKIIAEILNKDWNLMLRRIDQGIKTLETDMDKLKIIFEELCHFMKDVHGNWFETYPANSKDFDVGTIRKMKAMLQKQITERVEIIINEKDTESDITSDVIARILMSYSHEDKMNFDQLKPSLVSLLNKKQEGS